jgi:hypothetical protein
VIIPFDSNRCRCRSRGFVCPHTHTLHFKAAGIGRLLLQFASDVKASLTPSLCCLLIFCVCVCLLFSLSLLVSCFAGSYVTVGSCLYKLKDYLSSGM